MTGSSQVRRETLLVNGERFEVVIRSIERGRVQFELEGRTYLVERELTLPSPGDATSQKRPPGTESGSRRGKNPTADRSERDPEGRLVIRAPIPGVVTEVSVAVGENVTVGQVLLKLEAMKMQNRILSPSSGTVSLLPVSVGQEVSDADPLVLIDDQSGK